MVWKGFLGVLVLSFIFTESLWAKPAEFSIIHSNDLHSHFRPKKGPRGLGGYARLKTLISRLKTESPNSLALDGGDWSEGAVYFKLGGGIESLRLFDLLGFDASVVGNHDWLNGPDHFMNLVEAVQPKATLLSANLDLSQYDRAAEFLRWVKDSAIYQVGDLKVGVVGIATYEWVYDKFYSPISVREPFHATHQISKEMKEDLGVDVVIGVSHNSILANRAILKYAPYLDLIVGGHDHLQLNQPVEVGTFPWRWSKGWVVEAGYWGQFLGHLKLSYEDGKLSIKSYDLIPVDSSIPEDPQMLDAIENAEQILEESEGPIFNDHVGTSRFHYYRHGIDSPISNLVTGSYLDYVDADFAIESSKFIYGEIFPGKLSTATVYEINPAFYQWEEKRSWTLKTVDLPGKTLRRMLSMAFGASCISQLGLFSVSGLSFVYDPWLDSPSNKPYSFSRFLDAVRGVTLERNFSGVQDILIRGEPLDRNKIYRVALGQGIVEGLDFMNTTFGQWFPYWNLRDTGQETWRVLSEYVSQPRKFSDINMLQAFNRRIRPNSQDLSIDPNRFAWRILRREPGRVFAEVSVDVMNWGRRKSKAGGSRTPKIRLLVNRNAADSTKRPDYFAKTEFQALPSLQPDHGIRLEFQLWLKEVEGEYPVTAKIINADYEVDQNHHEVTHWFREDSDSVEGEDLKFSIGHTTFFQVALKKNQALNLKWY